MLLKKTFLLWPDKSAFPESLGPRVPCESAIPYSVVGASRASGRGCSEAKGVAPSVGVRANGKPPSPLACMAINLLCRGLKPPLLWAPEMLFSMMSRRVLVFLDTLKERDRMGFEGRISFCRGAKGLLELSTYVYE